MKIQNAKCACNLTIPINENLHVFKLAQKDNFFLIKKYFLYKIIRFHLPWKALEYLYVNQYLKIFTVF